MLETATKECDSPDVRDRAYVYWRLLSSDPAAAKAVVLADRPPIGLAKTTVPRAVLDELLGELSTLASVYHRPAETFVGRGRVGIDDLQRRAAALALEGGEDGVSARDKALHVVEQGQKAENLCVELETLCLPAFSLQADPPCSCSCSSPPVSSCQARLRRRPRADNLDRWRLIFSRRPRLLILLVILPAAAAAAGSAPAGSNDEPARRHDGPLQPVWARRTDVSTGTGVEDGTSKGGSVAV